MHWQSIWGRIRRGLIALRTRVNFKLIRRLAVATAIAGFAAIGLEALVRARIAPQAERIPTAIYTRPTPWGAGRDAIPVAFGAVSQPLDEERIPVAVTEVPDHLVEAVLAVEDQRFYRHHGLDFRRIGGALVANVKAGEISQGGSTITQQLAKNLFLTAARTPLRKLREAALAVVLEARYDKAAILEAYLNEIYLGQDGSSAIHGVGAAARYYFGKTPADLNLAESAILAGMIQAPNRFSPIRHDREARRRRNLVLGLMVEQERIGQRTADQAARARIGSQAHSISPLDARYFRDLVLAELPRGLRTRGDAVYTTLDAALQRSAERAIRDGLGRIGSPDVQAALVAVDPRTGDVLAMVGGRDYSNSQFNRALALRQPGSAFKPVVALAALRRDGDRAPAFTLASRVDDEPLSVNTAAGRWEPSNYDRSYRGVVTVREAIEQSLNVPFARIGLEIGPKRIVETARRLGFTSPLKAVPSLALGSSEVTLLELVRAYGVFATGGKLAVTRTTLGRGPLGGDQSADRRPSAVQVVDPAEAYLVTSALEGVIARGTGHGLDVSGRFGSIAGKTGTSNDWRDAWFVAYSPTLVVGVWVGFDDGRSLGLTGAGAALPIVARFLERADPEDPGASFDVPDGIEEARCGEREVFLQGTAPDGDCGDLQASWDEPRREWIGELESRAERGLSRLLQRLLARAREERGERPVRARWR